MTSHLNACHELLYHKTSNCLICKNASCSLESKKYTWVFADWCNVLFLKYWCKHAVYFESNSQNTKSHFHALFCNLDLGIAVIEKEVRKNKDRLSAQKQ